jgi:transcriptional regulator with PAS, ATPase and Fis domain
LENLKTTEHISNDFSLKSLQDVEKEHIKKVLAVNEWNKTRAAKVLGISRVSLISKVKKYNLE